MVTFRVRLLVSVIALAVGVFIGLLLQGPQVDMRDVGTQAGRWQGEGVHLVDGVWIGAERACSSDDAKCNAVVKLALDSLPPDERAAAKSVVVAELPTKFRFARLVPYRVKTTAGLDEYAAVVLESADGSRRLIGLRCYLPFLSDGTFEVKYATCSRDPLAQWKDGSIPRSEG